MILCWFCKDINYVFEHCQYLTHSLHLLERDIDNDIRRLVGQKDDSTIQWILTFFQLPQKGIKCHDTMCIELARNKNVL